MTITRDFTKEQLIKRCKSQADYAQAIIDLYPDDVGAAESRRIAEIALASLEAEPVGYMNKFTGRVFSLEEQPGADTDTQAYAPIYTAPPAPVSVPTFDEWLEIRGNKPLGWVKDAMRESYDACRAAMQGKAEPVTTDCKLPSREHFISLCNKFWNWQEADEINAGEEEPRLEWNGSEFTHRVTQALWRMYQASPGNSPVIPDGWVMVPVEPTHEMLEAGDEQFGTYDVYRRMIAAAPQQGVKP